ncbi:hypothetical protein ACHAPT_008389 [Fusarium lateritium]
MSIFYVSAVLMLLEAVYGTMRAFESFLSTWSFESGMIALRYNIERVHLELWCESVKVGDLSACLLNNLPAETQSHVVSDIAEMTKVARALVDELAKSGPPWASMMTYLRWTTSTVRVTPASLQKVRQRKNLEDLVNQMKRLNEQLNHCVPEAEFDVARFVTRVMTNLDRRLLKLLSHSRSLEESFLASAFKITMIQGVDPTMSILPAKHIDNHEIDVCCRSDVMNGRYTGMYSATEGSKDTVIVEWQGIKAGTPNYRDIWNQIRVLGASLSTRNAEQFHRMDFVGILNDEEFERRSGGNQRIGLVYSMPHHLHSPDPPPSLDQLIQRDTVSNTRPGLGDRFKLAYKLASAMSLFHATNWLHKSFRSDNILFTNTNLFGENADITKPYISGFGYNQPAEEDSTETHPIGDPRLDFYYHPDVMKGWTKIKDMYSLGIVLLEVAFWRSMFQPRFRGMSLRQMSSDIMACLEGKFGQDLVDMVGQVYVDAVKFCLSCPYIAPANETREEVEELSKMVSRKVIQPLASCRLGLVV